MPAPDRVLGTRVCFAITPDGVKLYGNREAFQSLGRFMTWIAESDPAEHFECHVRWHLSSEDALLRNGPANVTALFDPSLAEHFPPPSKNYPGFALTFMAVEENDLDEMFEHAGSGLLPADWVRGQG